MGINFFDPCCQTITSEIEFGLCDDLPPPYDVRAYFDTTDRDKWIAVVQNPDKIEVTFTAIDSCITIKRSNGEDSQRCDAMLTYKDRIIFVELKQRKGGRQEEYIEEVFKGGIDQLTETIEFFRESYPLDQYKRKTAYVANKLKPNFQFSNKSKTEKFKDDTGFNLKTQINIIIN